MGKLMGYGGQRFPEAQELLFSYLLGMAAGSLTELIYLFIFICMDTYFFLDSSLIPGSCKLSLICTTV